MGRGESIAIAIAGVGSPSNHPSANGGSCRPCRERRKVFPRSPTGSISKVRRNGRLAPLFAGFAPIQVYLSPAIAHS